MTNLNIHKYLVLFIIIFPFCASTQNVYIPDDHFEQELIDKGYDSGPLNDSIPLANISFRVNLIINSTQITSLEGLQGFSNLSRLRLPIGMQISHLDLSQNLKLKELNADNVGLTTINLNQNPLLESLNIGNNQLTEVDISQNPELINLIIHNNQLTILDLSQNYKLRFLTLYENNLTSLNLVQNPLLEWIGLSDNSLASLDLRDRSDTIIYYLNTRNNPSLNCIAVDNPTYSEANWRSEFRMDPHTTFNGTCSEYQITDLEIDNCYLAASIEISENAGNNNEYIEVLDATGKAVCSVNANGNDLGIIDFHVFLSSSLRSTNTPYMSRDLEINPEFQPNSEVTVIFYYKKSEINELMNANTSVQDEKDLLFTKINASCNGALSGDVTGAPQTQSGKYGNLLEDIWVRRRYGSFSTIYAHGDAILPVEISTFNIEKIQEENVVLSWETKSEINNLGFEIQKSQDGVTWEEIGFQNGQGSSFEVIKYSFTDQFPNKGLNYYRLKQIDLDNKFQYSEIKTISFSTASITAIFPNPTRGDLSIGRLAKFELYNLQGKLLLAAEGLNLDISNFDKGVYVIKVVDEESMNNHIEKIVLQK